MPEIKLTQSQFHEVYTERPSEAQWNTVCSIHLASSVPYVPCCISR